MSITKKKNDPNLYFRKQFMGMHSNNKTVFIKKMMHILKSILMVTARKSFVFVSWFMI